MPFHEEAPNAQSTKQESGVFGFDPSSLSLRGEFPPDKRRFPTVLDPGISVVWSLTAHTQCASQDERGVLSQEALDPRILRR